MTGHARDGMSPERVTPETSHRKAQPADRASGPDKDRVNQGGINGKEGLAMQTPSSNENTGSRWQGSPCVDCPWVPCRDDGQTMLPSFEDIPDGPLPREPRPPRRRRPSAPAPDSEPLFEIEEPNNGEVA